MERDDARLRLCAVTDDLRDGRDGLVARAAAAAQGGATMVLLRLKHVDARELVEVGRALCAAVTIPVMVSERVDVALACGAAGVHLGASSLPIVAVRPHVPVGFLLGGSVSSAEEMLLLDGADFLTIGPVFGDTSATLGLEQFTALCSASACPVLAVGGVEPSQLLLLRAAGASGVAVIRSLLGAADVQSAAARLTAAWDASQERQSP